ncbi:hypothetical protein Dimus_031690 [Dionaea muscipula]
MKRHDYEKMKRHDCKKMKNSPTDTLLAGSARFSSTPLSRFHYAVVGRGFMLPLYRAAAFSDVEPPTTQYAIHLGVGCLDVRRCTQWLPWSANEGSLHGV